ncbi:TMV resistance protein N-like [Malus domestica]|uniref:TMV resistance protein N-like n=1 Tax=Malus domestica TaxID=3750 RepID=UPI0010AAD915|nr:TMV resistance protein N-like isoform X1 [Malus domestica]
MDTSSSAHGAAAAASSSSSRSSNRWKYEVFLSFRGEDTRKTFTGHLFSALCKAGVNTFMDDQLTRGENIQRELDQEIEGSRIAVIVFSKRYAESRWCLRELSKIMRCREDQEGKTVCPIFYDVDPSEVRRQGGSFEEAFRKHESDQDPNEVKQWREDLKASADLSGWNLKTTADGCEWVFIEKIVGDVKGRLKTIDFKEDKHSVGMAFRVQEFSTEYLDVGGSPNVRIIGIYGMGGIGKTTLARAVCSNYEQSFSRQCYLEDVRSKKKEMVCLQEQLLRDILKQPDIKISSVAEGTKEIMKRLGRIKVLVVVDDIDDADQLDKLAIKHESFGPGSRIIIITRDEQVLNIQKVDKKYKAQAMTKKEALELFSWHAFGNDYLDKKYNEYIELARDIVDYCGGLPLALKVVGRLLATEESKTIWEGTLDKLRNIPNGKIHETLKLSYDGLCDDHVKGVFLDISNFFIGLPVHVVTAILDGCNHFSVEAEIAILCKRCLLYIENKTYKTLKMHDLIRDMGREIVRAESPMEGKRSRLWNIKDAKSVLNNESGTEAVEGLHTGDSDDKQSFRTEAFKKMWRLKFLHLINVKLTGSYKHLSKELRLLIWDGFPLEAIPANFDQRNLVCLNLSNSKMVRVWEDSKLLPKELKYLILNDCHNLTELPDFSKLQHLKALDLNGCKGLCGGYHFLAQLKMIEELYLSDCNITDGAVLKTIGSLSSLTVLVLCGNGFNWLPILSGLSQLQVLRLNNCTNLKAIPDLPNSLCVLQANYCTALEIMSDFSEMSKMRVLELKDCRKLKDIPNLENSLDYMDSLHMEGCTSLTATFKENLQTKNAFGGIFLSGNDIPNRLAYVARKDVTVKFEVPPSIDYIGGLALGIVYSSDFYYSTGSLQIHVINSTQRTYFRIRPMEATVIASHRILCIRRNRPLEDTVIASPEYRLWLGNLSNKKLNLKGGDTVLVQAQFCGQDNRITVNKIGVDIVKWDLSDGGTNWDNYVTMPYESCVDTLDDTQHIFLCYKTPEAWPWRIEGSESDPLPKFFASALEARKNDIIVKTLLTVIEGHEGTEFSDGDVLIFPQMIKYRGLKESDVDIFVEDVLVNHKPWASGVQELLSGSHVFVCATNGRHEGHRVSARILIDQFKKEAEGLTNQVFVTACYHIGGHNYAGTLTIYIPDSYGIIRKYSCSNVIPDDVPILLDKPTVIRKIWRIVLLIAVVATSFLCLWSCPLLLRRFSLDEIAVLVAFAVVGAVAIGARYYMLYRWLLKRTLILRTMLLYERRNLINC